MFEGHNIILHTGFFPHFLGICNESRKTNNVRPTSLPEDTRAQSTTTHSREHVALYSYWTASTGLNRDVIWVRCSMLPFTKLGDVLHKILPNFSSGPFLHLASVIMEPALTKREKRLTKVFRDWISLVSSSCGRKHPRQHCHLSMYLHLIRESNTGAAVSTPLTCVHVIRFI